MKYYACKKCGQVYHNNPPEECLKFNCESTEFEQIKKSNVVDMHDVLDSFLERYYGKKNINLMKKKVRQNEKLSMAEQKKIARTFAKNVVKKVSKENLQYDM